MERDIKRAKGPDEQPIATLKESVLRETSIEQLEAELAEKNATIERLTKEVRQIWAAPNSRARKGHASACHARSPNSHAYSSPGPVPQSP